MEWQPIETIPKTGEDVIVYCAFHKKIGIGYFCIYSEKVTPNPIFEKPATDYYNSDVEDNFNPTHWMPLPKPPSSQS